MKILFALILLSIAIPVNAKAHCSNMPTVQDGKELCETIHKVLQMYMPELLDRDWTIKILDRTTFVREHDGAAIKFLDKSSMFPPRCHTFPAKHTTECMGPFIREFSKGALAGTFAHEYGHILCDGPQQSEECADEMARKILRP